MKNNLVLKKIIYILEIIVATILLLKFCFYINENIVIKGLYMDDLYDWSWFPGLSIYDFAFKFYPSSSRYRPFFSAIQYFIYTIVQNEPLRFAIINKIYNTIVSVFLYHFLRRLKLSNITSFFLSCLYLISHFAYYQIGQVIGTLETSALFFAIIILFFSLMISGGIRDNIEESFQSIDNDNVNDFDIQKNIKTYKIKYILNLIFIYIMFFIIAFTHERYLCLAPIIFFAILLSNRKINGFNDEKNKFNILIPIIVFFIEIIFICILRSIAIGKVLPAGTGGTYVEDTFTISNFINFCFTQVAFIFGYNIGPDYLVGIDYVSVLDVNVKNALLISNVLIFILLIVYIVFRILLRIFIMKTKTEIDRKKHASYVERMCNVRDLLILSFIMLCIAASSVTIRIEMRFIYVSFVGAIIFLAHISTSIIMIKSVIKKSSYEENTRKKEIIKIMINKIFSIFTLISLIIVLIVLCRVPIELVYRENYDKIFCMVDQKRMNSLYDNTIGTYGVEDILRDKKIYIVKNYYGLTNFYAEYFFKIYDKENIGNKIILIDDLLGLEDGASDDNSIILVEDILNNTYKRFYLRELYNNE